MSVEPLFGETDQRYATLFEVILNTVLERGKGLQLVGVLGVLELVKDTLKYGDVDEE